MTSCLTLDASRAGHEALQVLAAAAAENGRAFPKGARLDVGHTDHEGATPGETTREESVPTEVLHC